MSSDGESTIKFKRSTISNRIPDLSALELGELAVNLADGKLFFKKINNGNESLVSFLNSEYDLFTFNTNLSSYTFKYGNNTVNEIFSSIFNGINNKISGAASIITNGEENEIQSNFSFIGSGYNNKILLDSNNSFNAAGSNNLIQHQNVFTLGSNITSHSENFTYVNNLSANGKLYINNSLEINNNPNETVSLFVSNNKIGINTETPTESLSINGNAGVTEDIEIKNFNKGVILRSPNNHRWRITVDNHGKLITTAL
jgi:hypothetical protein